MAVTVLALTRGYYRELQETTGYCQQITRTTWLFRANTDDGTTILSMINATICYKKYKIKWQAIYNKMAY